jgi:hypothetical protein
MVFLFLWIFFRILNKPEEFSALVNFGAWSFYAIVIISFAFSLLFAFLIGYRESKYGPARLFLGGLLLPALTWTVVRLTLVE